MFRTLTETTITNDHSAIFILDFRRGTDYTYARSNQDWKKVYANEFELINDSFSFKKDFVTSTENINFETLLPKECKIKKMICYQELGNDKFGSKITFSNGKTTQIEFPNPENNILLFRVGNAGYLVIPEIPSGKLIVCDVPDHLLDQQSRSIIGFQSKSCENFSLHSFDASKDKKFIPIKVEHAKEVVTDTLKM